MSNNIEIKLEISSNDINIYSEKGDATANSSDIAKGKTAYVNGKLITGGNEIAAYDDQLQVEEGVLTLKKGNSIVVLNLTPENIKKGVNILGITGTLVELLSQELEATPKTSEQVIKTSGGNAYTKVTIKAVTSAIDSNIKPENIKKGVTILGVTGTLEEGSTSGDSGSEDETIENAVYFTDSSGASGLLYYTDSSGTTGNVVYATN